MIFQILFEANIRTIQDLKIKLLNYYLKIENNYIDSFIKKNANKRTPKRVFLIHVFLIELNISIYLKNLKYVKYQLDYNVIP